MRASSTSRTQLKPGSVPGILGKHSDIALRLERHHAHSRSLSQVLIAVYVPRMESYSWISFKGGGGPRKSSCKGLGPRIISRFRVQGVLDPGYQGDAWCAPSQCGEKPLSPTYIRSRKNSSKTFPREESVKRLLKLVRRVHGSRPIVRLVGKS